MENKIILSLFIITYNNDAALDRALETLFESDYQHFYNLNLYIINNYSKINIKEKYLNKLKIINNQCRGDFFNPNLAQNHNQAIINGFEDLNNPKSDIVIHTHNDISFNKNWAYNLTECMKKFNFAVGSVGDQFVAYKPEAIKNIGLWDENFPGLVHKECDYFLRAYLLNKQFSYINDYTHGRCLNNEIKYVFDDLSRDKLNQELKSFMSHRKNDGKTNWEISYEYFKLKWRSSSDFEVDRKWLINWDENGLLTKLKKIPSEIKLFMKYPFFESSVNSLKEQNFLT